MLLVENCRGRLLRVMEWDARLHTNRIEHRTILNEPLDLEWSNHDSQPLTPEPGVNQRLESIGGRPKSRATTSVQPAT